MSSRRSTRRKRTAPRGVLKHCDGCLHPKRVQIYGNTTQARQASRALNLDDSLGFCTNSQGGVHVRLPARVIDESSEE